MLKILYVANGTLYFFWELLIRVIYLLIDEITYFLGV